MSLENSWKMKCFHTICFIYQSFQRFVCQFFWKCPSVSRFEFRNTLTTIECESIAKLWDVHEKFILAVI